MANRDRLRKAPYMHQYDLLRVFVVQVASGLLSPEHATRGETLPAQPIIASGSGFTGCGLDVAVSGRVIVHY